MNASVAEPLFAVNTPEQEPTWSERNQQWLIGEIARLAARINGENIEPQQSGADGDGADRQFIPALTQLTQRFGLSAFERDIVLLAAGVSLDAGLRSAVSAATPGSWKPTFGLALARLAGAHWDALSPQGKLRYWRLIRVEPGVPITEATLEVDEVILHYVSGVGCLDESLRGIARHYTASPEDSSRADEWSQRLATALRGDGTRPALVLLDPANGGDPADAVPTLILAMASAGIDTLLVQASDLPVDPAQRSDVARSLDREAILGNAAVLLSGVAGDHRINPDQSIAALLGLMRSPAVVVGSHSRSLASACFERRALQVSLPNADTIRAWSDSEALNRSVQLAIQQFRVGPMRVEDALASLDVLAPADREDLDEKVWSAFREAARGGLDTLAQRVESQTTFSDLVLPPAQIDALREITRQLRHRDKVYREWGFADRSARGLGLCALFTGESGTGKTMAAEAIANEVKLDLYRIDLATVVSKYIGETEKNLSGLFDAAEASGAVLLFDEADALFGKRSEVKDGHDRYANIEVAYLLQRIESYRGLAILTTNMKSSLDRAFLRRVRFVVQFPFPDPAARQEIWRRQFPDRAPKGEIDLAALASLQLAGGHIRSVVLNAAFRAAEKGTPIDMSALLIAGRAEYAKLERPFNPDGLHGVNQ